MAASQRAALPDQLPASAPMPDRYCFTLNFGHDSGGSLHSHYVPTCGLMQRSKTTFANRIDLNRLVGVGECPVARPDIADQAARVASYFPAHKIARSDAPRRRKAKKYRRRWPAGSRVQG